MPIGPLEIILLLVIVALIFGAGKLPQLMKGMGQGVREFKSEMRDRAPLPPHVAPPVPEVPAASTINEHR